MKKLLFICTGNTCRSPLAQVLATAILRTAGLTQWEVMSAGLAAMPNCSASANAQSVASELGLCLEPHRSQPLTPTMAMTADLVLVMTQAHKNNVLSMLPQLVDKVYTLTEFVDSDGEIQDPYGGSVAQYRETAVQLSELIQKLSKKLASI